MKVDDTVILKNKKSDDPRSVGKIRQIFEGNTYASVWWTMLNYDDETPPGIMIQTELIKNLELVDKNESR